jgi:hypothetical protein
MIENLNSTALGFLAFAITLVIVIMIYFFYKIHLALERTEVFGKHHLRLAEEGNRTLREATEELKVIRKSFEIETQTSKKMCGKDVTQECSLCDNEPCLLERFSTYAQGGGKK